MTFTWQRTARATWLAMFLGGACGASCSSPTPENGTNTNWQCETDEDCQRKVPALQCQSTSCSAGECICGGSPKDSGGPDAAKPTGKDSGVIELLPARCREPQVVGLCNAAFPRFYYDGTSRSCEPFIYGGCGGNDNNFETQGECEAACNLASGVICDRCTTDAGACSPTTDCPACPSLEGLATAQGKPCTEPGLRCGHDTSSCTCAGRSATPVWECRILPL